MWLNGLAWFDKKGCFGYIIDELSEEITFYILQRRNYERKKESNSYLYCLSVA